jgi:hypothetical protein
MDYPESHTEAAAPAPAPAPAPRLGEIVNVKVAAGIKLVNNETGQFYAEGTPTPALVNITLLRRLADGDITLA